MTKTSTIGAIAAMNKDRVIGVNNAIPWHYSEDFKRFKRITLHSTIIMGRKTWESIGSKPLPKRRNIVISRSAVDGIEHYHSIEAALKTADERPIWFIGGGRIYAQALPYCDYLDITIVPDIVDLKAAILFPKIDPNEWLAAKAKPLQADPRLSVQTYARRAS